MRHKKKVHSEKVVTCWQFAAGTYDFGDQNCWFSHSASKHDLEAAKFQCRPCGKEFKFQSDCLKHRKQEHSNIVPPCRNETNGTCKFGKIKCWFNHENKQNEDDKK